MNIAKACIKHKVATLLAVIMVVIFGVLFGTRLQMALMPNMEMPMAVVMTTYVGANPSDIEELVTSPLESAIMSVSGVDEITSTSAENVSTIQITYLEGTDLDIAATKLREQFDRVSLPDDASDPIIVNINISELMPTAMIALVGDDLSQLQAKAEDDIAPALERIDGVAQVQVSGGTEQHIAVRIDPAKAAGFGLSNSYISQFLAGQNLLYPGGDMQNGSKTLTVSTDALVLGGEAGESETFTITTTAAWKAVPSGEGFTLDKTEGTGDATVRVTAAAGNWDGYVKQLGSIEIAATNVDGVKTVSVSQDEITPVLPSEVTLVADFTLGASVATPELPPYSTDNFTTGRHEYTIGGYTFAIFVDPDEGGKFYWLDNKQFSPSIPDPAQGLFFSKLGAYVEFPAIAGKVLSEVHYLPTSQQNDVSLDLFGADNSEPQYTLDYGDDGTWSYTLIDARENLRYRIEITNKKNAQLAKLKLVYAAAK